MSSSINAYSGEPFRRTAADRENDTNEFLQNLQEEAYLDWPNEAGFVGLEEQTDPIEIQVIGTIPEWVQGSLYRTGPGQYDIETNKGNVFQTDHWFDGLAQTHRFDITVADDKNIRVFYSSRRQAHEIAEKIKKDGRRAGYTFGQKLDPCLGLYGKFMSAYRALYPDPKTRQQENINVAVQLDLPGLEHVKGNMLDDTKKQAVTATPGATKDHREKLPSAVWLLTDTAGMKQIDPDTLEPIGFARQIELHPDLKGQVSCAHGERDPATGDYINFNKEMGKETAYRCFRVSATTGKTDILATISRPDVKPAYIHSFFLSPRFAILSVPSSHLKLGGISVAWNRNVVESMEPFSDNLKTKWFVIDRHGDKGVVGEFETDAGFFFHSVNAFEERDDQDVRDGTVSLFCDVVQYPSTDIIFGMYLDVIMNRNDGMKNFWNKPNKIETANPVLIRHRVRVPLPEIESTVATPVVKAGTKIPILTAEQIFGIVGPHCGELPTYNPLYKTKRIRYVYAMTQRGRSSLLDSIVKTDMDTQEALIWNNPKGHSPSEAIFVPRPGGTEEDGPAISSAWMLVP
jgi:torulene dioxygenase